jgi:hypothetical protein
MPPEISSSNRFSDRNAMLIQGFAWICIETVFARPAARAYVAQTMKSGVPSRGIFEKAGKAAVSI